ncbi:DUF397 domain-containing protein [Actinomadura hibisca]|uniref:DUF397 domain-containing protein n=1 Tax=Actinomadura hibisca TaxID=68565 RepID=UPI000A025928|nr:DUF397 domain-containing protein [Actinomadura hibisca]
MNEPRVTKGHWRKSSRSAGQGTECVEVASLATSRGVAARDSKDPSGPVLAFPSPAWSAFLSQVKQGVHDLA